jgi:hypothetical protein
MNIVIVAGVLVTLLTCIPVLMQLRSHPRGLFVLFFAEMWERFSYYGMRGILIFYLTQHFLFDDSYAQGQYGAYTSLVYLLPLIGGFAQGHRLWGPAAGGRPFRHGHRRASGDPDPDLWRGQIQLCSRRADGGAQSLPEGRRRLLCGRSQGRRS